MTEQKICHVIPVQGSINMATGQKIVTMIATYPRSIHAQLLTHRVFNKNSSSSRAIPVITEIENIEKNPAVFAWTKNKNGMQGEIIVDAKQLAEIDKLVLAHRESAFKLAKTLSDKDGLNVHKQNVNRFLEPFSNITVLITATEWDNFEWLRCDEATQPEMQALAYALQTCRNEMAYIPIYEDEWHVPFIDRMRDEDGVMRYYGYESEIELSIEDALKISLSCAAQTSFRKLDDSIEKAESVMGKLFGEKVHASPSEHQAKPIIFNEPNWKQLPFSILLEKLPKGVTHIDVTGDMWSGSLRGFIQYRQLLPRTDKAKF